MGLGAIVIIVIFSVWKTRNLEIFNDRKPSLEAVFSLMQFDSSLSLSLSKMPSPISSLASDSFRFFSFFFFLI